MVLFKEVQRFRENLLWTTLLLFPVFVFTGVLLIRLVSGHPVTTMPVSNTSLALLSIFVLIPGVWALRSVKLTTIIYDDRIQYGWNMPTADLNELLLTDISEWSIIRYRFVGYGYRISRIYGTVHNLSGNNGLQIITNSGEKILIGTQRSSELELVISQLRGKQQQK